MNPRALIGFFLLAVGAAIWLFTPHNVTWGNHHSLRHFASWALIGLGGIFLLVGARR